jgi:hypothetical protein
MSPARRPVLHALWASALFAACGSAAAQTTPAPPEPQPDSPAAEVQTVEITGTRASVERSIALKRNAATVQDSITALAPASDPLSSWQVRHKGKALRALMGPGAAYAGDHVELSDGASDFASTVGIGAVVSTKFTWPVDPKPKDSFLLTPAREQLWRRWISVYNERRLPAGRYLGGLYDIAFDRPETHVVEKDDVLHYAFYALRWDGPGAFARFETGPLPAA